ncbi:MAG: beta-lactamase family protein [Actinomycetota bacterium]|nr:beta-lactamase family protein [Actinomycetota bacterium]
MIDNKEKGDVITRTGNVGVVTLVLVLATACRSDAGPASPTSTTSATSTQAAGFPIATFAAISEDPVTEELAATFQAALAQHDVADGGGMSATVMTAEGTWSGTTGKADGVRDLQVDDQFAIASITKSVVAAQVMLMVEAGELALDDLVADHLPGDLQFDTNAATIRQLLSHRSGIPDYYNLLEDSQQTDFQRVWTPTEILELLPTWRNPPGRTFSYTETNYLLLSLVIEHLRGRPLADVLRDGALAIDGLERLVHQPDESPTEPMAMPAGASNAVLQIRGGYLPSLASATAYHASGAIASDSPSLARWWRAFCAGEIVSQASLTEMSTFEAAAYIGGYGLGLSNPANAYAPGFGHGGQLPGYMSWAACLPEDEAVIVVLTNHEVHDGHLAYSQGLARPLVDALRSR